MCLFKIAWMYTLTRKHTLLLIVRVQTSNSVRLYSNGVPQFLAEHQMYDSNKL